MYNYKGIVVLKENVARNKVFIDEEDGSVIRNENQLLEMSSAEQKIIRLASTTFFDKFPTPDVSASTMTASDQLHSIHFVPHSNIFNVH